MREVDKAITMLRIFGDDLNPTEVSRLLGCEPTWAHKKGDEIRSPASNLRGTRKTGAWLLEAPSEEGVTLAAQVRHLLEATYSNPDAWKAVTRRFATNISIGVFMQSRTEWFDLPTELLGKLYERRIALGFELYDRSED